MHPDEMKESHVRKLMHLWKRKIGNLVKYKNGKTQKYFPFPVSQ